MGDIEGVPLVDGEYATALHNAVKENKVDVIRSLLDSGVHDVHAPDRVGRTPLHWALVFGHAAAAKLLVANTPQGRLDLRDESGCTPLHYAAARGPAEVARLLLERGAAINAIDRQKWTPLHYAAQGVNLSMVELLISRGADKQRADVNGATPCDVALKWGSFQAIACLKPDAQNRNFARKPVHASDRSDKTIDGKPPRKGPSLAKLLESWRLVELNALRSKEAKPLIRTRVCMKATRALTAALDSWRETEAKSRHKWRANSCIANADACDSPTVGLTQSLNDLLLRQSNCAPANRTCYPETLRCSFASEEAGLICEGTSVGGTSRSHLMWCTEWEVAGEGGDDPSRWDSPRERKPRAPEATEGALQWLQVWRKNDGKCGEQSELASPPAAASSGVGLASATGG